MVSNQLPSGSTVGWIKLAIGRNGEHGSNFLAAKFGTPNGTRIFTTIDGGNTWTEQPAHIDSDDLFFDEWSSVIAVNPQNERRLYAGYAGSKFRVRRSDNSGATWSEVFSGIHSDQQDLVFDGNNPDIIYLANDGGVFRSIDAGTSWDVIEDTSRNMRISQLYDLDISQRYENILACGAQDNGIYYRNYNGQWRHLADSRFDGTQVAIDQTNPNILYLSGQNGITNLLGTNTNKNMLSRSTNRGITVTPLGTNGLIGTSPWVTILKLDPTDPISNPANNRVIFVCGHNQLFRSTNGGSTWQRVNDSSGNAFTTVGTITALEFAPSDPSILYLGTGYRSTLSCYWRWHSFSELDTY